MGTVFGPLITACCGAITTLVVFTLTAIIQNLPEIMELLGRGWDAIFQLTYHLYRGIIEVLPAFLGFKKPTGIWLVIWVILLSLGVWYVVWIACLLVFDITVSTWTIWFAFAHGIYTGLIWRRLEKPNGFHLGRKIG